MKTMGLMAYDVVMVVMQTHISDWHGLSGCIRSAERSGHMVWCWGDGFGDACPHEQRKMVLQNCNGSDKGVN